MCNLLALHVLELFLLGVVFIQLGIFLTKVVAGDWEYCHRALTRACHTAGLRS